MEAASDKPVPQPVDADALDAERNVYYGAYGKALASWSRVEMMLSRLFGRLTGMTPEMASGVFYSARSYSGRSDMLYAALAASQTSDGNKGCFRSLLKKARSYYGFRNTIAHGDSVLTSFLDAEANCYRPRILLRNAGSASDDSETGYTSDQLLNCEANYGRLAYYVLLNVKWDWTSGGSAWPERCLELVRELPIDPHSTPVDPIGGVPQIQPEPSPP